MRPERHAVPGQRELRFDRACSLVEAVLQGPARQRIVTEAAQAADLGRALQRLRGSMRANNWTADADEGDLSCLVTEFDRRTRLDGFHVLHDWDGTAEKVNDETIPVDVLNYLIAKRGAGPPDPTTLAIAVDYYFFYLLALLSLRVWDDGDANQNLDRLNRLLAQLQGANGSGQPFVEDAESLILIATSHYEPDEHGYARLLERVGTLDAAHQTKVALSHAGSLGGHLRFGFEATYGRDTLAMRDDNGTDYPWLCVALATLIREYARLRRAGIEGLERERVVEAILNGLSPDARAFVGDPPRSLSAREADRSEFCRLFRQHRPDLVGEFERHRPTDRAYSPLSFFFNFSQNVLKGTVVDALLRASPWPVTLNDLCTGLPCDDRRSASREALARTLMRHARSSPDRIRGRLTPVIVYDPQSGRRAFATTMRKISGDGV